MNTSKLAWAGLLGVLLFVAVGRAATHTAASASFSDVGAAISSAGYGDTVVVPAGAATWSNHLSIVKGITLQGAGAEATVITSNYAASTGNSLDKVNFLIDYAPDAKSLADNVPFRITGFTFDFNNKCGGIVLNNHSTTAINKVRIDHNAIRNASSKVVGARAIEIGGTVYGVIDNNTFTGNRKSIDSYGLNEKSWNNLTFTFGSPDCMYYEDNDITMDDSPHSGGAGGRYCARYNKYTYVNTKAGIYPWFDMHGNMNGANYSTMGAEIYGNALTCTAAVGVGIFDQRGGKAMIFNNRANTAGSVSAKVREEYDDALNPTTNHEPQHVSDSYFWNNTKNGTVLVKAVIGQDNCNVLAENREFFNQNTSFDGTSGIGVGTLAARPATCTPGAAYWATDAGSQGTLYKCTAPNTWSVYYQPYTYPHPLRNEK